MSKDEPTTVSPEQNAKIRQMNWKSVAKDGNVSNIENDDSGWLLAGGKGPVSSHNGNILPKFQKRDDVSDAEVSKDSTKDNEEEKNPVFIIFSQWTIPEIEEHLYSLADSEDQIGSVRIDYFKGKQTDRTIALMDPNLYKVKGMSVPGFAIYPYEIRSHWYPLDKENETFDFFIPLPEHFSAAVCRKGLQIKMDELVQFGIFKPDDFTIYIPIEDREGTAHTKRAYIEFKDNVGEEAIVLARCVISYSKWSYKNTDSVDPDDSTFVKCYYKKDFRTTKGRSKDRSKDSSAKASSPLPRLSLNIPTIPVNGADEESMSNPFAVLSGGMNDDSD